MLLSGFFIMPGIIILLYSFREFKHRQKGAANIKHDERSEINRLKATDLSFRFLLISLMALIALNGAKIIDDTVFVALTGPILAVGITLYYITNYWYERGG